MKKWEHKIVTLSREGAFTNPNKSPEEMLNDYGEEGWEFAGFLPNFEKPTVVLKREVE